MESRDGQAIKLFEQAVERESHGLMTEAVEYYRKAFKLNEQVDLLYRSQELPQVVRKLKQARGKNTAVGLDEEAIRAINVDRLLDSFEHLAVSVGRDGTSDGGEGASDGDSTPSPLLALPGDVWVSVLQYLLVTHPESWFNFSITCKQNAYLGLKSSVLWRKLCNLVYPYQRYAENEMVLAASRVAGVDSQDVELPIPMRQEVLVSQYEHSWKRMLSQRPFIKFSGCYISVVNYYSEGGKLEFLSSWSNPVRLITYYRYLRFYPDGLCIKVLTHLDPNSVIPSLLLRNRVITPQHDHSLISDTQHSMAKTGPQQIYRGTWTISLEGEVEVVLTEGAVAAYDFHYFFQIKSLGPVFRHNKLAWKRYYAIRKEIDEATGEREVSDFSLRNERPFLFLRVRHYHEDTLKVVR